MRLDRMKLTAIADVLRSLVEEALGEPGRVARLSIPTSPSDRVQVFVKALEEGSIYLGLRRPGGKEDSREILALARHMGLVPLGDPERRYGNEHRPLKGPRAYLILRCELDSLSGREGSWTR